MKNPTVLEMTEAYLKEHGYDGLYNEDGECACCIDDLFPCGDGYDAAGCCAGYKRPAIKGSEYDFYVTANKWVPGTCPNCGSNHLLSAFECLECEAVWS